jgi:hypothetical protein
MAWDLEAILHEIEVKLRRRGVGEPLLRQHMTYHKVVLTGLQQELEAKYPVAQHRGLGG